MRFEWDEAKNRLNLGKHGIIFERAVLVFEDPHALSFQDRFVAGEERWQTFGLVYGRVVMVAHTSRGDEKGEEVIRLISARNAASHEKRIYEAHKGAG